MKEYISDVFIHVISCRWQCQHKLATENKASVKERYLLTKVSTMALRSSFETFFWDFWTLGVSEGTETENDLPRDFIIDLCLILDFSTYTAMHQDGKFYSLDKKLHRIQCFLELNMQEKVQGKIIIICSGSRVGSYCI